MAQRWGEEQKRGREVGEKGARGEKGGVKRSGVGESRSDWEPDRNIGWGGRGKWRKREGWREMARGATLILIFFSHLYCVPPSSFCSHILPSSQPSSLILVFPSHPFIHPFFLHHLTSHLLYSFHLSFVPLRFCIWDGEGCFACHTTFASPFPSGAGERERGREKRNEKEKKIGGGAEGSRGEKTGRSETKRKDHATSWLN